MEKANKDLVAKIQNLRDTAQANMTGGRSPTELSSCAFCNGFPLSKILTDCPTREHPLKTKCDYLKAKWYEKLRESGIYERLYNAHFPAIEARGVPPEAKEQYEQIYLFSLDLPRHIRQGNGLILKGPVGTMKTTLAVALQQEAILQGFTTRKILMQSLLDDIFTLKVTSREDWLKFERDLRETKLLVIDELGKHKSEGWVMTKFEAIVSERHERRRSTVFVSNLTAAEMKGMYSEGVIDRFNHVNEVVNFRGKSLREKGD